MAQSERELVKAEPLKISTVKVTVAIPDMIRALIVIMSRDAPWTWRLVGGGNVITNHFGLD